MSIALLVSVALCTALAAFGLWAETERRHMKASAAAWQMSAILWQRAYGAQRAAIDPIIGELRSDCGMAAEPVVTPPKKRYRN